MLTGLTQLSPQEEATFQEPKPVWTDIDQLTVIRPLEEHAYVLGDSVFQVEVVGDKAGSSHEAPSSFDDDKVLQICSTKSEVEVLWQDGRRTWQSSTALQQPAGIEEHQAWPGDHVIYRDEEAREFAAVVESMNPSEQTACICIYTDGMGASKTVSILDCKLEGSPDFAHGLGRGDVVLISGKGTGYHPPSVARLGKVMEDHIDEEEQEERLIFEGRAIAKTASRSQLTVQKRPRTAREAHDIDWYGVVVDCAANGRMIVQLPDGRRTEERVDRLSKLIDGFDDDDDTAVSDASSWASTDEEGQNWTDGDGKPLDPEDESWQDDTASEDEAVLANDLQSAGTETIAGFKVLEHAPSDHAFLSQSHIGTLPKSFLSRVQREQKILLSSLPGECTMLAVLSTRQCE